MVLWVFGYGSLVWKAGFEYDERIIGYVKGYRRVFYQGNIILTSWFWAKKFSLLPGGTCTEIIEQFIC
jgi:hypothetical protein